MFTVLDANLWFKPNLHVDFHLIVPVLRVKIVKLLTLPSSYLLHAFSPTKCQKKYVQEGSDNLQFSMTLVVDYQF